MAKPTSEQYQRELDDCREKPDPPFWVLYVICRVLIAILVELREKK